MENIFFDLSYSSIPQTLIKLAAFILATAFLLWLIYFILAKLLFRKSRQRKEITLRLVFLWTLFAYFILFTVYLFILFYQSGTDSLDFLSSRFYLGSLAQLTIFIFLIVFFIIKRHALKRIINGKSIN